MADYKQLLTKAIAALPENNGAQRREVYEKARKALVAQLRSISPPLAAREITQHRLELEDCIRQVEQEATESILGGFKHVEDEAEEAIPTPEAPAPETSDTPQAPVQPTPSAPEPEAVADPLPVEEADKTAAVVPETETQEAAPEVETSPEPEEIRSDAAADDPSPAEGADSEETEAEEAAPEPAVADPESENPEPEKPATDEAGDDDTSSIDAIIARANVAHDETGPAAADAVAETGAEPAASEQKASGGSSPETGLHEGPDDSVDTTPPENVRSAPAAEPSYRSPTISDAAVGAAMSRVREVDMDEAFSAREKPERNGADAVEDVSPVLSEGNDGNAAAEDDSQQVIDRAIEILDREARGEQDAGEDQPEDGVAAAELSVAAAAGQGDAPGSAETSDELVSDDDRFVMSSDEEKGGNALTIFLVLTILLLGIAGGGAYWAWREGYLDLDAFFAQADPSGETSAEDNTVGLANGSDENDPDPDETGDSGPGNTATDSGPGNTETTGGEPAVDGLTAAEGDTKTDDRLAAEDSETPSANDATDADKVEDRLTAEDATEDPTMDGAAEDGGIMADNGAQSLLLEASQNGQTGAVPFSGTVEWERGTDELGEPTLIGRANIPARNLGVDVLIRRNADPALPASHLVEVRFDTSETFVGGSIASFGGILFKNQELVPGRPLVGAPARILENMFLFALSSAPEDLQTNLPLIENNKWMDLAVIYGTGRQAIITLEKDAAAEELFNEVVAQWREASGQSAAAADGAGGTATSSAESETSESDQSASE